MQDNEIYFNGFAGSGESFRRIAAQMSASANAVSKRMDSSAAGAGSEAQPVFPHYFNGYAGNGEAFRRMAELL